VPGRGQAGGRATMGGGGRGWVAGAGGVGRGAHQGAGAGPDEGDVAGGERGGGRRRDLDALAAADGLAQLGEVVVEAVEGLALRHHLPQQHRQRPHVHRLRQLRALHLLRRHVGRRAQDRRRPQRAGLLRHEAL
jgi:hypothetical protein